MKMRASMKILQKYLPENQRDTTMGSNRVSTSIPNVTQKLGSWQGGRANFFSWSKRPLPTGKARAKEENLQRSRRGQKPTFESRSV